MCTHERNTSRWVTKENDWTGEDESSWEYDTVSACVDMDLHRYRCTMCGKVFYYSAPAREFYEKGVKSELLGLG